MPCTWYVSLKPSISVFQLHGAGIDTAAVQRNSSTRAHAQSSGTAPRNSASGSASVARFTNTSGPHVSTRTGIRPSSLGVVAERTELAPGRHLAQPARSGRTTSGGTGSGSRSGRRRCPRTARCRGGGTRSGRRAARRRRPARPAPRAARSGARGSRPGSQRGRASTRAARPAARAARSRGRRTRSTCSAAPGIVTATRRCSSVDGSRARTSDVATGRVPC